MSQRKIAKKLKEKFDSANVPRIRNGVIVSVGASTATVTIGSDNIPGVPFFASVTGLTAGSKVQVMFDGDSPVITGKLA